MKRNQWLAGILAAGLLCALPLSGAWAAPRARTRAAAPVDAGAASMTLAAANCTYGDTVTLKATYTPAVSEMIPAGAQVTFLCGDNELGKAELGKVASTNTYEATLAYDTKTKGLTVGENTLTASYTPSGGTPVDGTATVTLAKKTLTAAPNGPAAYNGTEVFKNVPLTLRGVAVGDKVEAKADLTLAGKDVGSQTVTAAADPAAPKSAASGTAKSAAPGTQKDAPAAMISLSGEQAAFYALPAGAVTGNLTIAPAKLTFAAGAEDKPYDGTNTATAKEVQFTGLQKNEILEAGTDYTVSAQFTGGDFNAADSPKEVQVTLTLTNSAKAKNYELTTATVTTSAKITPKTLTVASATIAEKVYDGNKTATVTAVQFSGLAAGEAQPALTTDYTATAEFADAHAGQDRDVTVKVSAVPGELSNYTLPSGAFAAAGTITQKPLSAAMVTNWNLGTYTYNGDEQKPVPTVADPGASIGSGDYELAYADNVNAGTATVTVKALAGGNYTGEVSKTFEIKKATPLLNIKMERKSESGKPPVLRVTVSAVRASTSAAWPTGSVDIEAQAGGSTRRSSGGFSDGALTLDLPDLPGASSATVTANYKGNSNYEPAGGCDRKERA